MFERIRSERWNANRGWRWSGSTAENVPLDDWPVDFWSLKWVETRQRVTLKDPVRLDPRDMPRYYVEHEGQQFDFVSEEFSPGVFGFFLPKEPGSPGP